MTSKSRLSRRQALGTLSATALPLLTQGVWGLPGYHPAVPAQEPDRSWRPRWLSAPQVDLLTEISDRILPETDTSGARQALVHQYIDFVVSSRSRKVRDDLVAHLKLVDQQAQTTQARSFIACTRSQRDDVLRQLFELAPSDPGREAVENLKSLTIRGYYRSSVGMHQELGYDGKKHLPRFEGCTHPEHLSGSPESPQTPDHDIDPVSGLSERLMRGASEDPPSQDPPSQDPGPG